MASPLDPSFVRVLPSLADVFSRVPNPRHRHGVRHAVASLRSLVVLRRLARIREMAVRQRWTEEHWELLREPLGSHTLHLPRAAPFAARFPLVPWPISPRPLPLGRDSS